MSGGPGVTEVIFDTSDGEMTLTRPDGRVALLRRPGEPERRVALHRRDTAELLSEELRRLDPDEVYAETIAPFVPPSPASSATAAAAASERRQRGYVRDAAQRPAKTAPGDHPEVLVHHDAGLLAKAAAARLVTRLVDAQASTGSGRPGADRRRHRHRGAGRTGGRAGPRTRWTGGGWTSGGATSGSCPPVIPSATRRRPSRPC